MTFLGPGSRQTAIISRTVSVELQQNEVSINMSVHTATHSAMRRAIQGLSQQPYVPDRLTPSQYEYANWPLAYKFPFVTNHHIVIKDRLMLIFCVYRPMAIKRQQHSVNLYYAALTSSVTQR